MQFTLGYLVAGATNIYFLVITIFDSYSYPSYRWSNNTSKEIAKLMPSLFLWKEISIISICIMFFLLATLSCVSNNPGEENLSLNWFLSILELYNNSVFPMWCFSFISYYPFILTEGRLHMELTLFEIF